MVSTDRPLTTSGGTRARSISVLLDGLLLLLVLTREPRHGCSERARKDVVLESVHTGRLAVRKCRSARYDRENVQFRIALQKASATLESA